MSAAPGAGGGALAARAWVVAGCVVLAGILAAGVVLWSGLPRWAPEWVEAHSPWLEPVLRAAAARAEYDDLLDRRLREWPRPPGPLLTWALDDPDLRVRWIAAQGLCRFPDAAALPLLLRNLGGADLNLRAAAASALLEIPDARATPSVVAALASADAQTGSVLIEWLVANGDWSGLLPVVESSDPVGKLRIAAAGAPSRHRHFAWSGDAGVWDMVHRLRDRGEGGSAAATLVPLLAQDQPEWRRVGVELLRRLGATEQAPRLVALLLDGEAEVRTATGDALLAFAADAPDSLDPVAPLLIRQLAKGPGPAQLGVARVLAHVHTPPAQEALAAVVRARAWDAATRMQALEGLAQASAPGVIATVAAVLRGDADAAARQLAARDLAGVRAALAERALLDACGDGAADVRLEAVAGLVVAEDFAVDAVLTARLGDADEAVRATAVESIAARRHAVGIAALVALVAGAQRDPAQAEEKDAVFPLWVSAFDELAVPDMPLDDAQRAVIAAMTGRREAVRLVAPTPSAAAASSPLP
jgi:HEAT repeat protein